MHILETYTTDDIIAEAEREVMNHRRPDDMFAILFSEALWEKALQCGRVHEESGPKVVFMEGLHNSIGFSMNIYQRANKGATSQSLAYYITSVLKR